MMPGDTCLEHKYRAAIYRVLVQPPFDLQVGQFSDTLKALYSKENCQRAAFLTAFNPHGVKLTISRTNRRNSSWNQNSGHQGFDFSRLSALILTLTQPGNRKIASLP